MARHQRTSKGKTIRPTFFVFCEGETEEAYISLLKRIYRIPVEISPKVAGNRITRKYIKNTMMSKPDHPKDKIFLLYDLDVSEMLDKLRAIPDTILLASNPCFELWYILHYTNHAHAISSEECVGKFERICHEYKKGKIPCTLGTKLNENIEKAVSRAKKLPLYENPSTSVYLLIDELEEASRNMI